MPVPSVTFRSELDPVVRKELDQLDGELTNWMLEEHDDDGRHTRITADAITVTGPLTITGGPLTVDGVPLGGGPPDPHHGSHEPGGSDALVHAAWTDQPTTFTEPLTVTDTITADHLIASGNIQGTVIYAESFVELPRSVQLGYWSAVPFNAANFAGTGGMAWTVTAGQVTANDYTLIGKTLVWNISIAGATLAGTSAIALTMTLPAGLPTARPIQAVGQIYLGGWVPAHLAHTAGTGTVTVYRMDIAPMALGTMSLAFQMIFVLV